MKLLYISSGYGGIYRMFDQWIEDSFIDSPFSCVKVERETLPAHMHKIRTFSPDFVFMMIGDHIPTELLHQFKQEKIPVVLWMTEDPFYIDVSAACVSDAQLILTIDEGALSFYKQMGADHAHYFPIPTNTHVFQKKNHHMNRAFMTLHSLATLIQTVSKPSIHSYIKTNGAFS